MAAGASFARRSSHCVRPAIRRRWQQRPQLRPYLSCSSSEATQSTEGWSPILNRPRGNLTGVSQFTNALIAKRLELLRELVPGTALIGVLMYTDNPNTEINTRDVQAAARAVGQQILIVGVDSGRDFNSAFTTLAQEKAGALLISPDAYFQSRRDEIIHLAARHGIPAIYGGRENSDAGGLISYGASQMGVSHQAGVYMGRILRGERPEDLPVMQPTTFELVINLKTAKALGLTVPPTLLARADEVIE